ncbi:MAG TPA: SIR2 family protein, partial [Afifellaceae bacterium]|nr:SIR2 family protein [Afifellaceae bacterium]
GDLEDEDSLVLAESDYFARLRFESPVDIKFRADALGRSVLFLGYSMSDMNIRLLLYRLWQIWQGSGAEDERPPSFLFTSRPDPVQEALMAARGIRVLTRESDDPQQALAGFLAELAERVDRQLAGTEE